MQELTITSPYNAKDMSLSAENPNGTYLFDFLGNRTLDPLEVHSYDFASDCSLEGVMVEVTSQDDISLTAKFKEEDLGYLKKFSNAYLEEALLDVLTAVIEGNEFDDGYSGPKELPAETVVEPSIEIKMTQANPGLKSLLKDPD